MTLKLLPRLDKYRSSSRHGLRSRAWGHTIEGCSYSVEAVRLLLHDSGTRVKSKNFPNSLQNKKSDDASKVKKDSSEVLSKEEDVKNITELIVGDCNHFGPSFAPLATEKAVHTRSNTSNLEKKQRFLSQVSTCCIHLSSVT